MQTYLNIEDTTGIRLVRLAHSGFLVRLGLLDLVRVVLPALAGLRGVQDLPGLLAPEPLALLVRRGQRELLELLG